MYRASVPKKPNRSPATSAVRKDILYVCNPMHHPLSKRNRFSPVTALKVLQEVTVASRAVVEEDRAPSATAVAR